MDVSIVIPVYNEADSLPALHAALSVALNGLPRAWEVIYVNDGSRDGSQAALESLAATDPAHVTVVEFRRNFGQTTAIAAGIDHARGDIITFLDADLQNDPADIPMMLAKLDEGYDVVSGWRKFREDNALTRNLPSHLANGLISAVTGVHLHDYGCTLKAYRREVITGFRLYGEMHRFIPVYANAIGAKILEVPVRHHARQFGKSKYGLERTLKVILDLIAVQFLTRYSAKPIYLFGGGGILMAGLGAAGMIFLALRKLLIRVDILTSPIFIISVLLVLMGFQSILMGLIAELLVRTYHESQQKTTYTVRKVISGQ
ncbi:MAG: glycosyltransferase [Anaerolineae bacterium CG_4_9_14_3_um_filter_57_17]|nr:glycosyltransferase family 2 protein [bacterium]NCT19625.1 glycosyltransferase family 2 protein [bacterium]OIO87411.1 MAG: glycosyltransferase [Anaerolineae bacterium CG2_30_57_67]PJB64774.1 MAG: glycosyltransferase [Anaerolineae bacterium CG_4_9_14_3_um_filter_57_17]